MKRILVTGGTGFIGSHTCLSLLEKDYELWVIDSLVNSSSLSLDRVKKLTNKGNNILFFKGDLRNRNFLSEVFAKANESGKPLNAVVHFAGLKAVSESISEPLNYWDVNVIGTLNLLHVMKENNCNTIVFSSSATIYGISNYLPIQESNIIRSINPYGTTKIVIEKLLNDLFQSSPSKFRICSLRYFNPIGAHPSGLIGECPIGTPTNIFPLIMQAAKGRIKQLKIYGRDWDTPDGTAIRDYIHVMDLAEGHLLALEYLLSNEPQIINLNLGTKKGTSVLELVHTFEKINNIKVPYKFYSRREGDYCTVIADNKKASSIIGWSPQRSLEEMCIDGWRWQCSNPEGYLK